MQDNFILLKVRLERGNLSYFLLVPLFFVRIEENMSFLKINKFLPIIFLLASFNLLSQVDPVLQENKVRADNAAVSQEKIDSSQVKIDQDSSEYKGVTKQIEGLKVYNAQKKKQIKRQIARMEEIEETMKYAAVLQLSLIHI